MLAAVCIRIAHAGKASKAMEDVLDFDINKSLKYYLSEPGTVPTPDADGVLIECENDPDALNDALVNGVVDPIVDSIAESPENIAKKSTFDSLQFLLKYALHVYFTSHKLHSNFLYSSCLIST